MLNKKKVPFNFKNIKPKPLPLSFLLFIALLSVSSSAIFVNLLVNVPAVSIAFWRMTIGCLILWFASPFIKYHRMDNENRNRTIFAGIVLGFHFAFFFGALKLTTIANATLFGTMAPLFTILFEWFIIKKYLHRNVFIGLIICFIGSLLLQYKSLEMGGTHSMGNLSAVLCSIFLAVSYLNGQKVRSTISTFTFTRTLFTSASVTLLILVIVMNKPIFSFTLSEYSIFMLLGIIPTIFGHGILTYALKYFPTTVVTSVALGEPIIASFFGWFFLNEGITTTVIFCGLLILIGLFLIIRNNTD